MNRDVFENLVVEALKALPLFFQNKLNNVQVVVEDWPDQQTLHLAGARHPSQLLGFYHGIPQTRRTHHYGLVLPDKISIYRCPIEMRCRTAKNVRQLVMRVVRHELAHHFGIDDEHLREIGAY